MTFEPVTAEIKPSDLEALIEVCERCACHFDCYCASNAEWARKKLLTMKAEAVDAVPTSPRS